MEGRKDSIKQIKKKLSKIKKGDTLTFSDNNYEWVADVISNQLGLLTLGKILSNGKINESAEQLSLFDDNYEDKNEDDWLDAMGVENPSEIIDKVESGEIESIDKMVADIKLSIEKTVAEDSIEINNEIKDEIEVIIRDLPTDDEDAPEIEELINSVSDQQGERAEAVEDAVEEITNEFESEVEELKNEEEGHEDEDWEASDEFKESLLGVFKATSNKIGKLLTKMISNGSNSLDRAKEGLDKTIDGASDEINKKKDDVTAFKEQYEGFYNLTVESFTDDYVRLTPVNHGKYKNIRDVEDINLTSLDFIQVKTDSGSIRDVIHFGIGLQEEFKFEDDFIKLLANNLALNKSYLFKLKNGDEINFKVIKKENVNKKRGHIVLKNKRLKRTFKLYTNHLSVHINKAGTDELGDFNINNVEDFDLKMTDLKTKKAFNVKNIIKLVGSEYDYDDSSETNKKVDNSIGDLDVDGDGKDDYDSLTDVEDETILSYDDMVNNPLTKKYGKMMRGKMSFLDAALGNKPKTAKKLNDILSKHKDKVDPTNDFNKRDKVRLMLDSKSFKDGDKVLTPGEYVDGVVIDKKDYIIIKIKKSDIKVKLLNKIDFRKYNAEIMDVENESSKNVVVKVKRVI